MSQNFSELNLSINTSNATVQDPVQDYRSYSEMLESIRHTQIGNLAVLAALTTAILFALIQYKTEEEDTLLRVAALAQFAVTEVFILGIFRFIIS